jgi:rhodanese-related sulfurtransferase
MNAARLRAQRWAALFVILALVCGGCARFHKWRTKPRPPYRKLSPPVAYEMMRDSPGVLVLDLRPPQQFNGNTGHIRQAKNIPLSKLPYRLLEIVTFREETVLIYCEVNECAEKATSVLAASGFENVVLIEGGIEKWIRQGFKTVLPANIAGRRGVAEEDDEHTMPERPGEAKTDPRREVPVKPPPLPPEPATPPASPTPVPPPADPRPPLSPTVAAPRQIG